jgi:hypothetical protein
MNIRSSPLHAVFALAICGCNKPEAPPPELKAAPPPAAEAPGKPVEKPAAPAPIVGMINPFSHLSDQAAKSFNSGWAGMKAKKYEEAAAAFNEVTNLIPDYLTARLQAARAYLLAADGVATRQQLQELVSRNFVAYGGRASTAKEFAPFRTSPDWPAYQQTEARLHAAYAQGLDHGLVLVARSGSVDSPSFPPAKAGEKSELKLDLKQEVYNFDPDTGRYRPLTASDGHVLMALRSRDGKRLAFLTVDRVQKDDKKTWFFEPQFGFVDLSTLETAGPLKLNGGHEELSIGFGASGTALVATTGAVAAAGDGLPAGTYELDTAHTGLIKAISDAEIKGDRVLARYDRLWHSERPMPPEVLLSDDRHSVKLGESGVITSARSLSESSLSFSPGQRFFLYAGQLDACAAQHDEKSKAAQNELFIYDVEKKAAERVDVGPSDFESVWLNDYLLAYEGGTVTSGPSGTSGGKGADNLVTLAKATINLYDVSTHKKTTLPFLRYGAGLYGMPTPYCPHPAAQPAVSSPVPPVLPASGSPAPPAPSAPAAPVTP